MEAGPITGAIRKKLGLPADVRGAVVTEVWAESPAAAAAIRPNDVVEEIGTSRIGSDCDFDDATFNRSCGPVRVTVWRSGARIEATLEAVDQTAFVEKACRDGSADACFREGWLLWSRKGGPNVPRALELFTAACKAGSARGCAYEALQLMDEPERGSESVAAAERSCQLGDASGCAHLAFLYATGKFVKKDDHRATALYGKACDLGDAQGCYNVGLNADEGRGSARDLARAVSKYEEACGLGSATGCTNLGFLYEHGRGVRTDTAKAFDLYRRGCDGTSCQPSNLNGCVNVGRAYRDGIGVEKSEARAAEIFREACDRPVNRDDSGAAENGSRACSLLGGLYIAGDGIPRDLAKGLELSVLGCDRGDSFGCFNAAAVYSAGQSTAADPAKAAQYLDLACKGGDGEGCFNLGVAYEKGNGVTPDRSRASQLFTRACQIGFSEACKKKTR
ncbi:MAG TPA: PDZ domain-containing protein [Thermoanaerobaculia bacterium]|nr:PDZ domain-containing protein [Thermoanaerobaculia bacterium]